MAAGYLPASNMRQRTRPADSDTSSEYIPLCHLHAKFSAEFPDIEALGHSMSELCFPGKSITS
jgi:hypothetical protein